MKRSFLKIATLSLLYSFSFKAGTWAASAEAHIKSFEKMSGFYNFSPTEKNQGFGLMKTTYRDDKNKDVKALYAVLSHRDAETIRRLEGQIKSLKGKIEGLESQLAKEHRLVETNEELKRHQEHLQSTLGRVEGNLKQAGEKNYALQRELDEERLVSQRLRAHVVQTKTGEKKEEATSQRYFDEGRMRRLQDSLREAREEGEQQKAALGKAEDHLAAVNKELKSTREDLRKAREKAGKDKDLIDTLESERDELARQNTDLERSLRHAHQRLEELSSGRPGSLSPALTEPTEFEDVGDGSSYGSLQGSPRRWNRHHT